MQNFNNHSHYNPAYHYVLLPLASFAFSYALANFFLDSEALKANIFNAVIAFCVLLGTIISRSFALKNQDRIIRMEMRQRYFELTGTSFSDKEKQLRMRQIIALRFAGDTELLTLMEKAIAEKLESKEIKSLITDWQMDRRRV